ncbi:MAG TPA: S53 family peptidase [Solirubrobacteraceae bacterium]|nr:S53 family peptidase [Solirubrobacteraceae bacterium]
MNTRTRKIVAAGLLMLCGCLTLDLPWANAPAQARPPAQAYRVSAVCAPPAPGSASCLALRLVAKAPLAVPGARALPHAAASAPRSASPAIEQTTPIPESLTPQAMLSAYHLPATTMASATQTIGIVDAYDDATVESDLAHYDQQFDLPACSENDGCFRKVNQAAKTSPLPPSAGATERGWAQEIATDVEMAHGVCQNCHIVLVEADSESYDNLEQAEQAAVTMGATEISNSWGGQEPSLDSPAFDHPGIVITASSGDDGYRNWIAEPQFVNYPAASPDVVAVGGTRLLLNTPADNTWLGEEVWNDGAEVEEVREEAGDGAGGGGCSEHFDAPAWQRSLPDWAAVGCDEKRAVADVSADADPFTGVAVYDSTESEGTRGWNTIGGTSVASPIIAAVFALAGGAHGVAYPARTLYENAAKTPASLHDVLSGSNGECLEPLDEESEPPRASCSAVVEAASCSDEAICLAGPGYDGPTGMGTPDGLAAFEAPAQPAPEPSRDEAAVVPPVPSPASPPPAIAVPLTRPAIRLSDLALTLSALIGLNHSHPRISQVGFAFDISAPARVRVSLAERVRAHRHARWQTLPGSLTLSASAGHNSRRLSGHRTLAAGDYRLTLTPSGGATRSLDFQIG